MVAEFDVSNSANWEQIYSGSFQANYVPGKATNIYVPIPSTEIPISIDSALIAIYCTSTTYPDSKTYLGSVSQALFSNGNFPTTTAKGSSKGIYSNQTVLIEFTKFDDDYQLLLKPKYYVEQLSLTIFKYLGLPNYYVEQKLNAIETKIDQILTILQS